MRATAAVSSAVRRHGTRGEASGEPVGELSIETSAGEGMRPSARTTLPNGPGDAGRRNRLRPHPVGPRLQSMIAEGSGSSR